jgi:putative spermidine/putrescine transport system substrate-binding protein
MRYRLKAGLVIAVFALMAAAAGLTACGDDDSDDSNGSGSTSSSADSKYPASLFDGLSGSVVWYDPGGGANTRAMEDSVFKAFIDETGVSVQSDYNADMTKFFASLEAGRSPWSVVALGTPADFVNAKAKDYLEPLGSDVPVDLLEPGTYDEYGFRSQRYGILLAWNTDKWPESGRHPEDITDLFNTRDFPGKRCLFKYPQYGGVLESALLADGVSKDQLYPLDVERAFAKLDTIKDDIVWWTDGDRSVKLIESGDCDMGIVWSGRAFNAVTKDQAPLAITWNGALYSDAYWAIPKGAPNAQAGRAMLTVWLQDKEAYLELVEAIPYTTPFKPGTVEYPSSLKPWLPADENLENAILEDDEGYYAKNVEELNKQFTAWVTK